jgi:hypothetical protein
MYPEGSRVGVDFWSTVHIGMRNAFFVSYVDGALGSSFLEPFIIYHSNIKFGHPGTLDFVDGKIPFAK